MSYGMISILLWKTMQPRLRSEVGLFSDARRAVVKVLSKEGAFYKFRGATTILAPEARQT